MSAVDAIRNNKTAILRILSGDPELILNKVDEKQLVTLRDYKNLKNIRGETVEGHVTALVDKILFKGEDTCQEFLKLLQNDAQIKSSYPDLKNLDLNYNQQAEAGENQARAIRSELASRLNNRGYINWLKAGRCLLILKQGLHPFTDRRIKDFHQDLLNQNSKLRELCPNTCQPSVKKFSKQCEGCAEWKAVILEHRRYDNAVLNWHNCKPPSWRTDPWELAKVYMPPGQVNVKGAHQSDASALLHLIKNTKCFPSVDKNIVDEVIKFRNELMHSSELNVSDDQMKSFHTSLKKLVQQFNNVPGMSEAEQQIDEMRDADLSIMVSGVDLKETRSGSDIDQSISSLVQWETELLRECLQELEASSSAACTDAQVTEKLKNLVHFLQAYEDLRKMFPQVSTNPSAPWDKLGPQSS